MAHLDLPGGISIFYEVSGEGTPILLSPGWTLNHHLWDPVVPELERFHRVVRYDPKGSGLSTSDPGLEHSPTTEVEDLAALAEALELSPAHLVGHSKGGRTVLAYAMLHPERTLSVTAIGAGEPHPPDGDGTTPRDRVTAWARSLRETARAEGPRRAIDAMRGGGPLGPLRLQADHMATFKRATRGYSGADLASPVPRRDLDLSGIAEALTVPVLYICGELDPFLEECRYAHSKVSGSVLEEVQDCGHYPSLEQPEFTARAILDFVESAERRRGTI